MRFPRMRHVAAQKQRQHLRGIHAAPIRFGEVRRPVHRHHARHAAALIAIRPGPFELRHVAGHAEEQHQVSAGRSAGRANFLRIERQLAGIGAKIAHRGLHVIDRRGKRSLRRQPVVGGRRDVAQLRQPDALLAYSLCAIRRESLRHGRREPPDEWRCPTAG